MATKIPTKREGNSLVLEDGVYQLKIDDAEERTSPNSGKDYLQLRMSVLQNGEPKGRSIWDILSFSEGARFKFDQIFDALETPDDLEVTAPWFIGKRVYAQLATDEYNGNLKNVVKTYLPKAKGEEMIAKQKEARLLAGDVDEDFEAEEPVAPKANGRKTKNRPADVDDNDMPM